MASNSTWKKWLKRLTFLIIGLYVLICAVMFFFQEKLLFRPTVLDADAKWNFELEAERGLETKVDELNLEADFEGKINVLHFHAPDKKGVVLYIHGNGGNIQGYISRRNFFLRNGWDLFIMDYRGFGKSTGELSEKALDADVEACWNHLAKSFSSDRIIVYGHSLGTGFATRLASRHKPKMLILETPYTSLADVGQWQYPWLPIRYLIQYPSEAEKFIAEVDAPVIVFHGTADQTIPYSQGERMAKKAKNGRLITIEGAGHNGCKLSPLYGNTLDEVLK